MKYMRHKIKCALAQPFLQTPRDKAKCQKASQYQKTFWGTLIYTYKEILQKQVAMGSTSGAHTKYTARVSKEAHAPQHEKAGIMIKKN